MLMIAIFAGGCFWGVEHLMQAQPGVETVQSGYIGGTVKNPTYEQVCTGTTGHYEAVRVSYDPQIVSFETLCKLFLEIHDPTQADGQGPDHGSQYNSAIFYGNATEKATADRLLKELHGKGYDVVTKVLPVSEFYPAEQYHQDYYERKGTEPYCHSRVKRF